MVDDHQMFREGLARVIEKEPDLKIVGQCASGTEALALLSKSDATVVLLDVNLGPERALDFVTAARRRGFEGKILIVTAGTGAGRWALVVTLVLTSTIGLYYYTRLIVAMFVLKETERRAAVSAVVAGASGAVLAALTVLVVVLGVYPTWLVDVVERVVVSLS